MNISDEVSACLLSELGIGSITAAGVRHAPGEVIGGETRGEAARLRAKADWDRASGSRREAEVALQACAEGCRHANVSGLSHWSSVAVLLKARIRKMRIYHSRRGCQIV